MNEKSVSKIMMLQDEIGKLAKALEIAVEALENVYGMLSPYLPCEDAWDDDDHLVQLIRETQEKITEIERELGG